jgi:tRNA-2-methylthio-N6-dimethylallyladenosine synthase
MPDQVSHQVKRERMASLVDLVQRRATERATRFIGREVEVLVEGPSRKDPFVLRGRNRHNKTTTFEGTARPGDLATVKVERATSQTLSGTEVLQSVLAG